MSQQEKAAYFRALKDAGVKFDRHYREYKTEELKAAWATLQQANAEHGEPVQPDPEPAPKPQATAPQTDLPTPEQAQAAAQQARAQAEPQFDAEAFRRQREALLNEDVAPPAPRKADPNEMPGQRLNSQDTDEPIRVDENGLIWYQEEVRKPAYPKPRGRRVLRYMDTGVKQETVNDGKYVETFEVAGEGTPRPSEVKITLPSYQVGIYKDRRFPFRIHVYNEQRGFDLFEVQNFYGGPELVPTEIKRIYVENVLCYDIRTTVRAIQTEYRQQQLAGRIK